MSIHNYIQLQYAVGVSKGCVQLAVQNSKSWMQSEEVALLLLGIMTLLTQKSACGISQQEYETPYSDILYRPTSCLHPFQVQLLVMCRM